MSFMDNIKNGIKRFMAGRHGADELSLALLIAGLVISMLAVLTGMPFLSLLSTAAYVYSVFRLFSRNTPKRFNENQRFLAFWRTTVQSIRQFVTRLKNSKKYKYFKCPQCHSRLRLPRNVGEVTVTCGKCKNAFKQKA